ncbi:MAG: TetR/AcrR family transcriptional regulator [Candidatus Sericytochromatia bacterium]|nr:TetR/AcrR family transcriptional regulator [Candidatus Sericytochromatia bacterium]
MKRPTELVPRKRPVQQRSKETVEAILEAAGRVFASHGFAAGTSNRIAARAGVSIGSFYQYFPNKDAIVVALMERHMAETTATFEALKDLSDRVVMTVEDVVRHFVMALLNTYQQDPALFRVLFEEAPRPLGIHNTRAKIHEAVANALVPQMGRLITAQLRDPLVSAHLLVEVATASVRHFVLHTPAGLKAETFAEELIVMIVAYLVGPEPTMTPRSANP